MHQKNFYVSLEPIISCFEMHKEQMKYLLDCAHIMVGIYSSPLTLNCSAVSENQNMSVC